MFVLENLVLVGLFFVISVIALFIHQDSMHSKKVPMTFLAIGGFALWIADEPGAEPFPGAIQAILILAIVFQIVFAGVAYFLRDPKPRPQAPN